MSEKKYLIAIDQGTTSCRAILFDLDFKVIEVAQKEYELSLPQPLWVEQDPHEIWFFQEEMLKQVIEKSQVNPEEIATIGITNQRETTVIWNRKTGKSIHPAIVWQDQRTKAFCEKLKKDKVFEEYTKKTTGLVIDTYFSATKIHWLVNNINNLPPTEDLLFGTIDTWLIWNMTNGEQHVTDTSNASRTMLFDINNSIWDSKILAKLDIPIEILPKVLSSDDYFGSYNYNGIKIPINAVLGDQQSALFGQQCFEPGMMKNTYGTGCFMLMNTGSQPTFSSTGMLTTIAWTIGDRTTYALEGSIFIAGAAIQWLRDNFSFFEYSSDSEEMAKRSTTEGLFFVPAFSGLGAPYWDMNAKGTLFGITRDTNKNDMVRATLESIAWRTNDIVKAMITDANISLKKLLVDGGVSNNDFLMQFQANVLGKEVIRPAMTETTALGVAMLASISVGLKQQSDFDATKTNLVETAFKPRFSTEKQKQLYDKWLLAIDLTKKWGNG